MKQKKIVFLESHSTVMIYKIAKMFKQKGYETILIRLLEQNREDKNFYNQAFDQVIDFNFGLDKNILKVIFSKQIKFSCAAFMKLLKLKPYVIIGRSPPNILISLFRIFFRKTPFIYFPYDIRAFYAPTIRLLKKARGFSIFEIKAERFCFEHADGILHKGDPKELEYLNNRALGKNIKLPEPRLAFHPYCSKEFIVPFNKNKLSKKDREIHLVCVAAEGKISEEMYANKLKVFTQVINQKIHVHLYLSLNTLGRNDLIKKSFKEKYKNFPNIKYFHIHNGLNPKEIVKEISKYDFGLSPHEDLYAEFDLDPRVASSNKVSTYLEAGITLFHSPCLLFASKLLNRYDLDLIWPKDIGNLKKIIEEINYKKLEKNVKKAREDFLMEKHFPRLEEFIKKVVTFKKTKKQLKN